MTLAFQQEIDSQQIFATFVDTEVNDFLNIYHARKENSVYFTPGTKKWSKTKLFPRASVFRFSWLISSLLTSARETQHEPVWYLLIIINGSLVWKRLSFILIWWWRFESNLQMYGYSSSWRLILLKAISRVSLSNDYVNYTSKYAMKEFSPLKVDEMYVVMINDWWLKMIYIVHKFKLKS